MAHPKPLASKARLRVAVFGATGYAGVELLRILVNHPKVSLTVLTSRQFAGKRIEEIYPSLSGKLDLVLQEARIDHLASRFDLAFASLPHGVSMEIVSAIIQRGKRVIDLSADFRLRDPRVYEKWYRKHQAEELLGHAVYGLTELHR
ncbi:MAG: N-acetyl-gamma-glutamyl-phosphate reductase, partial [Candidatus Binatota bacterium]